MSEPKFEIGDHHRTLKRPYMGTNIYAYSQQPYMETLTTFIPKPEVL